MTGTHVTGAVGSGEVSSSSDTTGMEQMMRNGSDNRQNGK
jgi:hypothetical protein